MGRPHVVPDSSLVVTVDTLYHVKIVVQKVTGKDERIDRWKGFRGEKWKGFDCISTGLEYKDTGLAPNLKGFPGLMIRVLIR